jgi:hypothetical protein
MPTYIIGFAGGKDAEISGSVARLRRQPEEAEVEMLDRSHFKPAESGTFRRAMYAPFGQQTCP